MSAGVAAAVLLSGAGAKHAAIAAAVRAGTLPLKLKLVLSDRADAPGLARAREAGLPALAVPARDYPDRASHDAALAERIDAAGCGLVILAGYLRIFETAFVARYAGRMINLHPSLLPRHRGLNTHARAIAAGDRVHGTSIHFVTPELDGGPLIAQGRVPVRAGDTPEQLGMRVRAAEHSLYPAVLGWYARGALALRGERVHLDGLALAGPVTFEFDEEVR